LTPKRIVITGGPSTGKTSLITALENNGHYCFHEVIRLMTQEAKEKGALSNLNTNPIATVSDPMAFNKKIMEARLAQYTKAENMGIPIAFYDRGIPDVLAYMNYFKQNYEDDYIKLAKNHSYDAVFILPIWKDIYVADEGRFESYSEALEIHEALKSAYSALNYEVIEVPKDTIENRIEFILKQLSAC